MEAFANHMDKIELSGIRLVSEKAAELERSGRRILRLNIGEPDFTTPRHIIDAGIRSLENLETHYTPNRGLMELRVAVADKLLHDNGISYDPASEIIITYGCAEALFAAISGLLDPGDEFIVIEPAFLSYRQIGVFAGAVPVAVHARESLGWMPGIEDIEAAVTEKTRMIILNSPCNPTGAVYTRKFLEQVSAIAIHHDLIVVSDEVYEKLIYGTEHVSIASIDGMKERTVTINGCSKAYAMTGWRVGYLAAPERFIQAVYKLHLYSSSCMPSFSQRGAVEALKNGAADVEAMRRIYERRRNLLLGYFENCPNISLAAPGATFYMYLNISKSGMDSDTFCNRLLEEKGVAAVPGTAFESHDHDHIRISFATDEETLKAGAERICELSMGV